MDVPFGWKGEKGQMDDRTNKRSRNGKATQIDEYIVLN